MKRISTLFLQGAIILIAVGTMALLLWEPHIEGRNAHATPFEIYFNDPFLTYVYIASIPFFTILYQIFKLLRYVRQNEIFSPRSVKVLRIIKYCAIALIVFIMGAEAYFFIIQHGKEDIAGGVVIGAAMMFIAIIIGSAAIIFEKILQSALDIKAENDLTI